MGVLGSKKSPIWRENRPEKPTARLQVTDRSPEHKTKADVEESNRLMGNRKSFHPEILASKGHCLNSELRAITYAASQLAVM